MLKSNYNASSPRAGQQNLIYILQLISIPLHNIYIIIYSIYEFVEFHLHVSLMLILAVDITSRIKATSKYTQCSISQANSYRNMI